MKKTPCIFASNHRKIDREKSTVTTKNPGTKRRQIRSHKIVRVTLALALAGKVGKLLLAMNANMLFITFSSHIYCKQISSQFTHFFAQSFGLNRIVSPF